MKLIFLISYISFFFSNFVIFYNWKYFLLILLMLEFMMLNVFLILNFLMFFLGLDFYFLMIFLVVVVCEGVLGVSLMVNMFRMIGVDYFSVLNSLL